MRLHLRTALIELACLAESLAWPAALRPRPARSRAPEIVDLAPHEWRCIAERTLSSHEGPLGARVYRYRHAPGNRTPG